ncbi:MAG: DUF1801 domain-containing protein [Candidatus Nealsonbacteria bacterium]|nr:DUF1801 domain-containing protein [Candidatus Nealsonbacteria bacterium]
MNKRPKNVEAYIASAPKEVRGKLKELRTAIRLAAPKAEEKISYGMPYYGYHGRLAYFAYFKDHVSLFAMPPIAEEFKKELKKHVTGKSTIRFSFDEKLPTVLIKKIIKARAKNNEAKTQR